MLLILLADTRKKLLWLWIGATAALGALFFVQTLAGQFEDIEGTAWTWLFAQLLPGLLLLFVAVLLNKNASKVLPRTTFQAVYAGGLTYLLLLLATLLALPFATRLQSIEAYFHLSYDWLLPFQGLVLTAFGLLYFRKEAFFRPSAAIMQEYVAKKGEFAQRTGHLVQVQAFGLLIQEDGLGKTLDFLGKVGKDQPNDLLLLQSQYAHWKQQRDLNLAAPDFLQRDLNRMILAVIDYIESGTGMN